MTTFVEIDGYKVPVIENIHQKVYAAAAAPGALNMTAWHTCKTTHCRAGWVVALAGRAGERLENEIRDRIWLGDTGDAAWLIYRASDPSMKTRPNWNATEKNALASMKRHAEQEAARQRQMEI